MNGYHCGHFTHPYILIVLIDTKVMIGTVITLFI